MLKKLIATRDDVSLLLVRLGLGLAIFPHGAQKLLGWFGGGGVTGTTAFLHGYLHVPMPFVYLAIAAEFLGAIGLIVGGLARVAAFGVLVNMVVAVATVHAKVGFFMNWGGQQKGEGFEYHILAGALALAVLVGGAGKASLDRVLARGFARKASEGSLRPAPAV